MYFPRLPGEDVQQSEQRAWHEWKQLEAGLNRQATIQRVITAHTTLRVAPPLEDRRTLRLLEGVLLQPTIEGIETNLGEFDDDDEQQLRNAALKRLTASGQSVEKEVRTLGQEIKAIYDHKKHLADAGQRSLKTPYRFMDKAKHFADFIGKDVLLSAITGQRLKEFHAHLSTQVANGRTAGGAKDIMVAAIHILTTAHAENDTLPNLPKILSKKPNPLLQFHSNEDDELRRDTANWHEDLATLAEIVRASRERTKLFIYLMLNCGFQQTDIAHLSHEDIDWATGRFKNYVRHKSRRHKHAPKVTYQLWPETLERLEVLKSDKSKARLNDQGKPCLITNDRNQILLSPVKPQRDTIQSAYERVTIEKLDLRKKGKYKPLAALRKTSATLLEHSGRLTNHQQKFDSVSELFLGHTPSNIKGKHYAPADHKLLEEGLHWLGDHLRSEGVLIA